MNIIDKQQIINLEEQLLTAIKELNIDKLEELLHDDLLFVIPTGETVTKTIDLSNLKSGKLKITDLTPSQQEIKLIGDNAIVSVQIHLKGRYLDQPVDGKFKYIRTWKLFKNQWKVIAGAGIQL